MKKYILSILSGILLVSCVDTNITPYGQTTEEDYWQTKSQVAQVVTEAYKAMASVDVVNRLIVWGSFRSDELLLTSEVPATNGNRQALSEIKTANIETTNAFSNWGAFYSVINYCNLVIDMSTQTIDRDPAYTTSDNKLDIAQMKALRALCYFYLVRTFRDVPYITQSYNKSSQEMAIPQTPPAQVLEAIIKDLEEAAVDIYDAQNFALNNWRSRGYLNRDAVYALLADIHLWRASVTLGSNPTQAYNDYAKVVEYADKVIDSKNEYHKTTIRPGQTVDEENLYPALSPIEDWFQNLFVSQNAEESIFELEFSANNTALINSYYSYAGLNYSYGLMQAPSLFGSIGSSNDQYVFIQSYDTRRKSIYYNSSSADETYNVAKMISETVTSEGDPSSYNKLREGGLSSFLHNWIVYRMTDVMLMKAEALTEIADHEASEEKLQEAFSIVKAVNDRALYQGNGVKPLDFANYNTIEGMESLVMAERLRELCFEGKRWFDLLRMNYRNNGKQGINTNYNAILADQSVQIENNANMLNMMARTAEASNALISKMKTEPYLYMPIADSEMKLNSALRQNPAYSSSNQFERNGNENNEANN